MPGKRAASPVSPKKRAKLTKEKAPPKKKTSPKKAPPKKAPPKKAAPKKAAPKKAAPKKAAPKKGSTPDIKQTPKTLSALKNVEPAATKDTPVVKPPMDPSMKGPVHKASTGVDQYTGHKTDGFWNIASWNVNGLRAILKNNNELAELVKKEQPHIICLQEVKIDDGEALKLGNFIPGYQVSWNCCQVKKGYSGTATLIRDDVVPKFHVTADGLGADHNEEGRFQLIEGPNFYLINTYVPNAGSALDRLEYRTEEWDQALRELLCKKVAEGKKGVIWTGDLNVAHTEIDLANPATNSKSAGFTPQERNSFTDTLEMGFTDTFRHFNPGKRHFYSYWGYRFNCRAKNTGWRLDYFVVNDAFLTSIKASSILSAYHGSDHCPVQCLVEME